MFRVNRKILTTLEIFAEINHIHEIVQRIPLLLCHHMDRNEVIHDIPEIITQPDTPRTQHTRRQWPELFMGKLEEPSCKFLPAHMAPFAKMRKVKFQSVQYEFVSAKRIAGITTRLDNFLGNLGSVWLVAINDKNYVLNPRASALQATPRSMYAVVVVVPKAIFGESFNTLRVLYRLFAVSCYCNLTICDGFFPAQRSSPLMSLCRP